MGLKTKIILLGLFFALAETPVAFAYTPGMVACAANSSYPANCFSPSADCEASCLFDPTCPVCNTGSFECAYNPILFGNGTCPYSDPNAVPDCSSLNGTSQLYSYTDSDPAATGTTCYANVVNYATPTVPINGDGIHIDVSATTGGLSCTCDGLPSACGAPSKTAGVVSLSNCTGGTLPTPSPTPTLTPTVTPSGPTPTPTATPIPTPVPTPDPCHSEVDGVGRSCLLSNSSACTLCGNHCAVAGDQPLRTDSNCPAGATNCVEGIVFNNNATTSNTLSNSTIDGSGNYQVTMGASNSTIFGGPISVCVPNTVTAPAAAIALGDYLSVPKASRNGGASVDNRLVSWTGSDFLCSLTSGDVHRQRGSGGVNIGCSCASGFEPTVLTPAQFSEGQLIAFDDSRAARLQRMWAVVVDLLRRNQGVSKKIGKFYDHHVKSAMACTPDYNELRTLTCAAGEFPSHPLDLVVEPPHVTPDPSDPGNNPYDLSGFQFIGPFSGGDTVDFAWPGGYGCVMPTCVPGPTPAPDPCTIYQGTSAAFALNVDSCTSTPVTWQENTGFADSLCYSNMFVGTGNGGSGSSLVPIGDNGDGTDMVQVTTTCQCRAQPYDCSSINEKVTNNLCSIEKGTWKYTTCFSVTGTPTPTPTPTSTPSTTTPTPIPPTPTPVPTPIPYTGPVLPLYVDGPNTAMNMNSGWYTGPAAVGGTVYGIDPSPMPAPYIPTSVQGLKAAGGGYVMGCVKSCPANAVRGKIDPALCDCTQANQQFNPLTWSCQSCPEGSIIDASGACACPAGYSLAANNKCRPISPVIPGTSNSEFGPNTDYYPVCGKDVNGRGRLPVKQDFTLTSAGSNDVPSYSGTVVIGTSTYSYVTATPTPNAPYNMPVYVYSDRSHCACTDHAVPANPANSTMPSDLSATVGSSSRFYPDSLDAISSHGSDGLPNQKYGMVAIAKDGTGDGRLGLNFMSGASVCGCPNVNEIPNPAADPMGGNYCKSALASSNAPGTTIFTRYNPIVDDKAGSSHVMNRAKEAIDANSQVVSTVAIPGSQSLPGSTSLYNRMIWKCQNGFTLDTNSGTCTFDTTKNACDTDSPVSTNITGGDATTKFGNAINKKLACCMNMDPNAADQKFDCVENSTTAFTDFNDIWSKGDAGADGGQPNAMILVDGGGKPVTGFYTLNGARCSQYSEFSTTPIVPGVVNASVSNGQQNYANGIQGDQFQAKGAALGTAGTTYTQIAQKINKPAPSTTDFMGMRRCPILVRAALMVSCGPNTQSTTQPISTITDPATGERRCATASSAQVHVRIEQIYEISGQPKMVPVDTVLNHANAGSISISNLVKAKYGN